MREGYAQVITFEPNTFYLKTVAPNLPGLLPADAAMATQPARFAVVLSANQRPNSESIVQKREIPGW